MRADADVTKRAVILRLYNEGVSLAKIANQTRVSKSRVKDLIAEMAVLPQACGAAVEDIESGRGCDQCVLCKAVEARFERWALTQRYLCLVEA